MSAMAFVGCQTNVDGIPFKGPDDSNWGMIAPDGTVIFQDEFKKKPSIVRNNRFFVKNSDGIFELYETGKMPKKIGSEYVSVTVFNDDRAIVAEKGSPLTIIDTDGKVIKTIDKVGGKIIEKAECFVGTSIVITDDTLYGVVDRNGEMKIKPIYNKLVHYDEDKFLAVKDDKRMIVDKDGKELISLKKYEEVRASYETEYLAVRTENDGEYAWGILNCKGENVVRPSNKYKSITNIVGENFIFEGPDGYGLMTLDGETLIRAKYKDLEYVGKNLLAAYPKYDKCFLINEQGEKISEEEYRFIGKYNDGDHAFAKVGEEEWIIIDKEGKEIKNKKIPDIEAYGGRVYSIAESDYLDIDGILNEIDFNPDGMYGLTTNSTAKSIAEKKMYVEGSFTQPSDYTSASFIKIKCLCNKVDVELFYEFDSDIAATEWIYDENDTPHPLSFWLDNQPTWFAFQIDKNERITNNSENIQKAIVERFKKFGTVEKQKDNATLINLTKGGKAVVCNLSSALVAIWGENENELIDSYYDKN